MKLAYALLFAAIGTFHLIKGRQTPVLYFSGGIFWALALFELWMFRGRRA